MPNSIFSRYKKGEDRVTSTILAVFERLNTSTVANILQALVEDSTIELVKYENQINADDSVPDGIISGLFDYVIETKVKPNQLKEKQLKSHCEFVEKRYKFSKLLVITPDNEFPEILKKLNENYNDRIIWGNFDKIIDGIDYLFNEQNLIPEREKFLLQELKDFIINEDLISEDSTNKVLIVPAGNAWKEYKKYSVYKCQVGRTFQKSSLMGFYADGEIKEFYPTILGTIDNFNIQTDDIEKFTITCFNNTKETLIKERIKKLKRELNGKWNERLKYFVLTSIDDDATKKLENTIRNDKKSYSGKGTAYVQKQTYSNIEHLKGKKLTCEI